ncbi:hypothetical protein QUA00_33115 [Microcoleus sp. T2B6]|uniref:hypothetical protein n=1 Tax=Microcoleus sp. T2B6 TaxID=3055424 RepID=UPI002FD642D8
MKNPLADIGTRCQLDMTSCSTIDLGVIRSRAGLFNLLATFLTVGEPAPCILKEVDCDLLLGGGGFIQIVGTC